MGSVHSPFIVDDAIIGLAQPLTEALNQLTSGPRRACDLIEELGRREDFYFDLAGGSSGRTARAVFHNAHLPNKLPRANRAEKDGIAIEFPQYVDGTTQEAKNTVRRISLSEEDLPFGEVRASHCGPLNRQWVADHSGRDPSHAYIVTLGLAVVAFTGGLVAYAFDTIYCFILDLCSSLMRRSSSTLHPTEFCISIMTGSFRPLRMFAMPRNCDRRWLPAMSVTSLAVPICVCSKPINPATSATRC